MDRDQRNDKTNRSKTVIPRQELRVGQWVFFERVPRKSKKTAEDLAGDAH